MRGRELRFYRGTLVGGVFLGPFGVGFGAFCGGVVLGEDVVFVKCRLTGEPARIIRELKERGVAPLAEVNHG